MAIQFHSGENWNILGCRVFSSREAAEAKEVSDADECEHEWIPRSDYGFDICRKCHTTREAAEAEEESDD